MCILENLHSQLLGNHVQIDSMSEYRLFQCNSGEYVSQFDVCDGLKTCLDASDERNCPDEKWAGKVARKNIVSLNVFVLYGCPCEYRLTL